MILADIGLLDYAARRHPGLRRHLSVQAAASNPLSIDFYREAFGVSRVVLPRVLAVKEVAALIARMKIEAEVFAFGSLGTMVEGRCYLSSYITGRSPSSDGVCAPAEFVSYREEGGKMVSRLGEVMTNCYAKNENAAYPTPCKSRLMARGEASYLFEEPVGLNAASILKELKAAGVTALKIEGRQRSRAYVAEVVAHFRAALDALARGEEASARGRRPARDRRGRQGDAQRLQEGLAMSALTLGPLLFNWKPERRRDFYFRVADEAPVDCVYLGEVVCSKREPFFVDDLPAIAERLAAARQAGRLFDAGARHDRSRDGRNPRPLRRSER